jgi:uncharacterized protein YjiS (DUF1127 family)
MATIASAYRTSPGHLSAILVAPLRLVSRFIIMLAEANAQMRALNQLNQQSDHALSAKGLTREGEIRRIMGVSGTL